MKSIFRLLLSLLLITASIGIPQFAAAQCGLTGFTEPGVGANLNPPCGTFTSVNVGPGTQTSFQVLNGASYTFSTCTSAWDTEITGRNAANAQQFYNDDSGPICATTRASVTWTAGYTGTVFAVVTRFACQLGGSSSGVSAILQYRQNNNLLFTSSAANMCPAQTRTLFATPTGGAFSGTGVSGTTFTAPSSGPVVITYTYGACSTTQTINIDAPQSAPTGATASPATLCSGSSVLTASGGTLGTGGTYQWYAGGCGAGSVLGTGSSITVTPLATTNYFVRITGACSTTTCVQTTVNVSSASTDPTGIATSNNNFCPGASATLTVQGGSLGTGATWRWYSGTCCAGPIIGSGASITVTPATTTAYFVRAEGAACGNSNEATVTINVNTVSTAPTGIASSNGTTFCNGLGTTVLSIQGGALGTGAQWNWYSGTCGGTFISAGTSSITVNPTSNTTYFVRAEGTCPPPTACAQVTINVSAGLTITSISKTDVTCNGANDGTATVNVTGGQTPYSYTWSPGSGGATRTGLAPVSYDVTVTDAIGCTTTGNVVINQPPLLQITAVAKTDISCNGANDGTITVTAIGGTGALQYTINSFGTTQTSNQFTGLGVGGYTIGVIDASGCTAVYNANPVTINQPAPLAITVTSTTDASCSGVNNGSITVSASGGTGGYLYSLNGSPFQIGTVFGNLSAGAYTLFVQDNSGCLASVNDTLLNVTFVTLTVDSSYNVSCAGNADGGFEVTLSNGVSPYQYSINGITYQTSGAFTGLSGGTYTVLGRDAAGCQDVIQITISEAPVLVAVIDSVNNLTCNGSGSGGVFISVSGGTPGSVPTFNPLAGNIRSAAGLNDGTFSALSNGNLTGRPAANGTCCSAQDPPTDIYEFTVTTSGSYTINNDYTTIFDGFMLLYTDPLDWTVNPPATYVAGNDNCTNFLNSCVTVNLTAGQTYYLVTTRATGTNTTETWNTTFTGPGSVLEVTGFAAGYTYVWSNGAISQDIDSVPAGTYTVTVTDGNGCSTTVSATITQPLPLTVSLANLAEVRCNGASDGEVDITVTGGTPPYSFTWSNGTLTEDNTNLVAGTYDVTVTDASGCTTTDSYTLGEPTAIAVTGTVVDASCGASTTGSVDVSVSGGVGPYSYFWSNGQTTEDITGLSAGVYTIQVQDSRNCISSASFTVGGGASFAVTVDTVVNILCYGDTTGSIEISVPGSGYTFIWSNGDVTQNLTNVGAGTYTVTVSDGSGCQAVATATITQPSPFVASATATNVTCNGSANGAIDVTVNGGLAPYTYAWSNGATSQDLTGLAGGTYTATITDANGCSINVSATVTEPAALSVQGSVLDVNCNGGNNGIVNVSVSGGVPSYTYAWSNGGTSSAIFNLTAGNYDVTATDANGCTVSQTFTVVEPPVFSVTVTGADVSCNGGSDGTVTVTLPGGGSGPAFVAYTPGQLSGSSMTGPSWNALSGGALSGRPFADGTCCSAVNTSGPTDTLMFTVDVTGTYTILNTQTGAWDGYFYVYTDPLNFGVNPPSTYVAGDDDGPGGIGTSEVTVALTAGQNYYLILSGFDDNDNGPWTNTYTGPGQLGFMSSGGGSGSGPYTYNWSTGDTSQNLTNVDAGTYTVVVTNANGCTAVGTYTVTEPTVVSVTETITNVSCNGGSNGSISISIAGGTSPYDVTWSNGVTVLGTTTSLISNLAAGTYTATITDANGCVSTVSYSVTQPTAITAFTAVTNAACNGAANGAINLTVSGGTTPYTFAWSNGATTEDLTGLAAGTYTVTITDANGCTATTGGTVAQPTAVVVQGSVVDASCNGAADGDIYVTPSGGTGVFTYLWSNSATSQNLINVAAGTYTVTVTDANGCTATGTYTITDPAAVTSTLTVTDVLCFGTATGGVDLTPAGGVAPYRFLWSNFSVSEDLTNVPAGTYVVVITDVNGCTSVDTAVVGQNPQLAISGTESNVTCFGANDGSVQVVVSGGVGPYTYAWSSGGTADLEQGLAPSTYTVTATDAVGCTIVGTYTITGPSQILGSGIVTNVTCNGSDNGAINLTVAGGTAPYNYLWSNNATTEDVSGLAAATYSVTLTDANGCQLSDTFDVTQPDSLLTSITNIDANCNGASNGSASLTVTGGTGPYTYFWSNFRFTKDVFGLTADEYFVLVTDANGCQTVDSVTIGEPTLLTVTGSAKGAGCGNEARGAVDITVSGGTTPYTFLWSTGSITEDITGLGTGTYCVTITDANGCQAFFCAVVSAYPLPVANFSASLACDDQEVTFTNSSSITAGSLSYFWDFGDGDTTSDQDPIHIYTAPGTYSVSLIATSSEGCTDTLIQSLVVNPTPDATITANGLTGSVCSGDSVLLEAPTGAGYSYLWSNGDTTQNITVYTSGTYGVVITSSALCNGIGEIEVGVFSEAAVTISQDTTVSLGYSTTLEATGGIAYEWSPSTTLDNPLTGTPVATPFELTTYSVTVTVSDGCVTTREVTVTVNEDFRVDVPNLFTPNGDGINDFLVIQNIFTYQVNLMIFNRWGTEVYASSAYQNDWNGTNDSGDNLTDGTYYYVITVGSKVYKGAITILR